MKQTFLLFALFICANTFAQHNFQNSTYPDKAIETASLNYGIISWDHSIAEAKSEPQEISNIKLNAGDKTNLKIQGSDSPYEWEWVRDGIWTGAALGGSVIGYSLIIGKDDITEARLQEILSKESDINFLDKWAAGNDSETALGHSNIPFALSFAAPLALLFDDKINDNTGVYLGLYLESLATTAALYTITAGLVNRSRPYVYGDEASLERRLINNGQRSFYSGHVAASATATFFAAKTYTDFHPETTGKVFIWGGAAAIPATVAYFRIKAGQHFLTDVLLGYVLGAGTGILVPELHKKKMENIDIYPSSGQSFNGDNYSGMAFRYTF